MPKLTKTDINRADDRLQQTVTIHEVAIMYGLSKSGVMYHLDEGNIYGVQTLSGVYLLDMCSVIIGMGIPPYPGRACRNINWRQVFGGITEAENEPDSVWWNE